MMGIQQESLRHDLSSSPSCASRIHIFWDVFPGAVTANYHPQWLMTTGIFFSLAVLEARAKASVEPCLPEALGEHPFLFSSSVVASIPAAFISSGFPSHILSSVHLRFTLCLSRVRILITGTTWITQEEFSFESEIHLQRLFFLLSKVTFTGFEWTCIFFGSTNSTPLPEYFPKCQPLGLCLGFI